MLKHIGRITLLSIVMGSGFADPVRALDVFLQNKTVAANFTQTVYGKKKNRVTIGVMRISRPNKFSWQYSGNDGQLIVSDGVRVYVYDKLLQQVTIKKLDKSLGKSPALLLAGGTDIKKYYTVVQKPDADGLEWVSLVPIANKISENNGFKLVDIGFNKKNQTLTQMKFVDGFDNKSSISFEKVELGINYSSSVFKFNAPNGTDIINADN